MTFMSRPPEFISVSAVLDARISYEVSIVYRGPPLGVHGAALYAEAAPAVGLQTLTGWLAEE